MSNSTKNSLTGKLFKKLTETNQTVQVNDELLSYFHKFSGLDEYQCLVKSLDDPVERSENLKKLVFRLYGEHKLKDLDFFKYLVWSGQEDLCKLIGYGDKQIKKFKEDKPVNQKPHLNISHNDEVNTDGKMERDRLICQNEVIPRVTESYQSDVQDMETDMPIRQNDVPATTKPEAIPTETSATLTVGPTCIIYSKENSDAMLDVSDLLRNHCGISCDIDQYNIPQWGVWIENKIKDAAKSKGFVLLLCSRKMYEQLSEPNGSRVEMLVGHLDTLTLNSLIREPDTTCCIIPICLEETDRSYVPISLHDRKIYILPYRIFIQVDQNKDITTILNEPGLESLKGLVYKLRGDIEVSRPPIEVQIIN